ncbi:hypothetical protein, partial [Chryseobacterium sp. CH25]|uniref:hypothetical protein n=1 Tax=Chryseobacterium sp. CH25 TaxID=713559 RepID=UPI001025D8D8
ILSNTSPLIITFIKHLSRLGNPTGINKTVQGTKCTNGSNTHQERILSNTSPLIITFIKHLSRLGNPTGINKTVQGTK